MKKRNFLVALFIGGSVLIISFVFHVYQIFYSPVVNPNQETASILIKPEDDIDDISRYMADNQLIDRTNSIRGVCRCPILILYVCETETLGVNDLLVLHETNG